MNIKNTIQNRILMASQYEKYLTESSNSYIGVGRPTVWETGDDIVPDADNSTKSINDVYKNLVFLKKITSADIMHVAPHFYFNDWVTSTVYKEYNDKIDLYTTDYLEQLSGNVTAQMSSLNVVGQGTTFTSDFIAGSDKILIYGANDSVPNYGTPPRIYKEVVSIANDTFLTVNSVFDSDYTQNNYALSYSTYPAYTETSKSFIMTSSRQVFKCLFNNNGAQSTVEPQIDVGGSLPTNPYIETADGYKWKYMYTLAVGEVEKFSENYGPSWLPVKIDPVVSGSAVDGRIDIIKLINGGTGYLSGGNSSSANIISVIGNGTGANVTANVVNGVITGINILDGGSGYTNARIVVSGTGANANLVPIIGPRGGHGHDPITELGAAYLMISVELDEDGGGKFPTENSTESFDFRQISIITDPIDSDGNFANNLRYNATYVVRTSTPPGGERFYLDDRVYQGTDYANSTFSGTIAFWDETVNEVWINNVTGTISLPDELKSNSTVGNPTVSVTAFQLAEPEINLYSGDVLYIRNYYPMSRSASVTEQIRILASF
jgi:hypothetical protein